MQHDNTQLEILRVLQELRTDLQNIRGTTPRQPTTPSDGSSTRKYTRKTPDAGGRFRKNITNYCWTHGDCAHESKDCPDKAQGHQNNTTFDDKKGGSCARCE